MEVIKLRRQKAKSFRRVKGARTTKLSLRSKFTSTIDVINNERFYRAPGYSSLGEHAKPQIRLHGGGLERF